MVSVRKRGFCFPGSLVRSPSRVCPSPLAVDPGPPFAATPRDLSPTTTGAWFIKWLSGERMSWLLANTVFLIGKSHTVRFTLKVLVSSPLESE